MKENIAISQHHEQADFILTNAKVADVFSLVWREVDIVVANGKIIALDTEGKYKASKFIDEYLAGKTPRQIFSEHGFDVDVLGMKRVEQASSRWRKAYDQHGLIGLTDTRKTSSGRPLQRELTMAEVLERQAARIQLLEGQVELLKKLEVTERRLLSDSQKQSANKVFQLISDTLKQFPFKRMVTYFVRF